MKNYYHQKDYYQNENYKWTAPSASRDYLADQFLKKQSLIEAKRHRSSKILTISQDTPLPLKALMAGSPNPEDTPLDHAVLAHKIKKEDLGPTPPPPFDPTPEAEGSYTNSTPTALGRITVFGNWHTPKSSTLNRARTGKKPASHAPLAKYTALAFPFATLAMIADPGLGSLGDVLLLSTASTAALAATTIEHRSTMREYTAALETLDPTVYAAIDRLKESYQAQPLRRRLTLRGWYNTQVTALIALNTELNDRARFADHIAKCYYHAKPEERAALSNEYDHNKEATSIAHERVQSIARTAIARQEYLETKSPGEAPPTKDASHEIVLAASRLENRHRH